MSRLGIARTLVQWLVPGAFVLPATGSFIRVTTEGQELGDTSLPYRSVMAGYQQETALASPVSDPEALRRRASNLAAIAQYIEANYDRSGKPYEWKESP